MESCAISDCWLLLYFQKWDIHQVRVQHRSGYSLGSLFPLLHVCFLGRDIAKSSQGSWPPSHQAHSSLPYLVNSTQKHGWFNLMKMLRTLCGLFVGKKTTWGSFQVTVGTQNDVAISLVRHTWCVVYFHLCFFALNEGSVKLIGVFREEITPFLISFSIWLWQRV